MEIKRKPDWLKVRVQSGADRAEVEALLGSLSLNTVCEQASCPNLMECYSRRTATFMILGCTCTRNCTFCDVSKGIPSLVDEKEPEHVAVAVKKLMLKHAVITSVTRDDLEDGGAQHFAEVIREIRKTTPNVTIEVLIPDFKGDINALQKVVNAKPDIINHNVETVPRLYDYVRPMAIYERSLQLLANVKELDLVLSNDKKLDLDLANVKKLDSSIYTKSGIMVGLGETQDEVIEVMKDLRKVQCDILTVGQYLSPSSKHHEVIEYVHPDIFEFYKSEGEKMGFRYVASGPLVRSSYHADKALEIE